MDNLHQIPLSCWKQAFIMCTEDFLLSLKANHELFNFIQQATLLLTFASSILCYFAFKDSPEFAGFQKYLQGISMGLWVFSAILILIVAMAYMWERRYQKTRNVWGETIYQELPTKKLKRKKVLNKPSSDSRMNVCSNSTFGSLTQLKSLETSSSSINMSANDVLVDVNSSANLNKKVNVWHDMVPAWWSVKRYLSMEAYVKMKLFCSRK